MKKKKKKAVFIRWKLRSGCLVRGVQLLPLMHGEWWKMSAASRSFEWVSVGHLKYQNRTLETLWVGLKSRGTPGHAATLLLKWEKKAYLTPLYIISLHWRGLESRADRRSHLQPKQINSEKNPWERSKLLLGHTWRAGGRVFLPRPRKFYAPQFSGCFLVVKEHAGIPLR